MRLGIDLGGSKTEIIALAEDGRELLRQRIPTPQGDYMATVMAIAGLVERAENTLGQRGSVGVGIPGAESLSTGLIKNAKPRRYRQCQCGRNQHQARMPPSIALPSPGSDFDNPRL